MRKKLLFWIFLSVIVSANEDKVINENKKENPSIYLDEKPINNQMLKSNDILGKYDKNSSTDITKFKKVSLMDVVLETVSNSDLLKAEREQIIQSEIKLKDAIAGYYPTLNFQSENKGTTMTAVPERRTFKYYNDRNYKFILNQNLYSGGDTSNTIKSLEKKLELEKNQYQIVLQDEITKAIKAYFDVVFANRTVLATESNMKNLNKILEIVQVKYDNGAASIGDLTAIKANVSNSQTQLTKVRSNLTAAMRYYEYMVGENYAQTMPYEKNFNINVSTFDLLYERGIKNNNNILGFYKSIDAEKFNLKSKESGFSPKLDFEAAIDNVMDSDNFKGRTTETYGLFTITFNLYNGGKDKNKILTSYSAIREANFKLEEEKKKLKWNISKLFTSIQSTNESLKSNISEVISLRKMVDAYWEDFNLGHQDLQTLLQGHKQLNSAETELIKYENNNITDFFTLLGYTGDLLAFFDMDPEHPKFIDFSKSNYSQDVYIDDKFLNEKERLEREQEKKDAEELRNSLASKAIKDENIDNFTKNFLAANDEFYTIEMGTFANQNDAVDFIKDKDLDKNAFAYNSIENLVVGSKVVYGIFLNPEAAKVEIDKLPKEIKQKNITVKKVKDVKNNYNEYIVGLKVKTPDPEVKLIEKTNTIEKVKQEKKVAQFQFNEVSKNNFLKANPEFYTINITSFNDKKELEKILTENPALYENSFVYNYSNGTSLVRWDYGIYPTYNDAQKAIETLGDIGDTYYPVVQKISNEQELNNTNIVPEVKEQVKEPEFEYVNVTSKTEYKEAVPFKDGDLKNNKVLEEKVKSFKEKRDPKPTKEKDEPVTKVITKKIEPEVKALPKEVEKKAIKEEIKLTSKKIDPKPIKEKEVQEVKALPKEVERKAIKEKEEIKPTSKRIDPKPIKEKDEPEVKAILNKVEQKQIKEETKPTSKKSDPKPIKEKDEPEVIQSNLGVR